MDGLVGAPNKGLLDQFEQRCTAAQQLHGANSAAQLLLCAATYYDIILDRFPRSVKLYNTPHAPRAVIYVVPMLIVCELGACNPMLRPIHALRPRRLRLL